MINMVDGGIFRALASFKSTDAKLIEPKPRLEIDSYHLNLLTTGCNFCTLHSAGRSKKLESISRALYNATDGSYGFIWRVRSTDDQTG